MRKSDNDQLSLDFDSRCDRVVTNTEVDNLASVRVIRASAPCAQVVSFLDLKRQLQKEDEQKRIRAIIEIAPNLPY